jgi:gluconate 2-dehydrogenase gamma chain
VIKGRRFVLRLIGAAAGTPLAAAAQPVAAVRRRFFNDAEVAFVTAAVDRLLPADDFPSASEAGVVDYIDGQLAGPYGAGARIYLEGPFARGTPQQGYQLPFTPAQLYRRAIAALPGHLGGRALGERPAAEQDAFLRRLEAGELMLGDVPSAVFFETLLANTIEGYFADPVYGGNRDMAGWRMIGYPGAYAQFVQWVDKHGIRFNRPPMSIAMSAGGHQHGATPAPSPSPLRTGSRR